MRSKSILALVLVLVIGISMPAALAQKAQPTQKDIEEAKKNLEVIRGELEGRRQALNDETDAINQDQDALAKMRSGQTLRGSRADNYVKKMSELSDRRARYDADRQKLDEDVQTYEAAVEKMKASVAEASEPPSEDEDAETSAMDTAEREALKMRIDKNRKELSAEFKALMDEKKRISAEAPSFDRQQAFTQGKSAPSTADQMNAWNEKMRQWAGQRKSFNDAVKSYNTTTGENIGLLPGP